MADTILQGLKKGAEAAINTAQGGIASFNEKGKSGSTIVPPLDNLQIVKSLRFPSEAPGAGERGSIDNTKDFMRKKTRPDANGLHETREIPGRKLWHNNKKEIAEIMRDHVQNEIQSYPGAVEDLRCNVKVPQYTVQLDSNTDTLYVNAEDVEVTCVEK